MEAVPRTIHRLIRTPLHSRFRLQIYGIISTHGMSEVRFEKRACADVFEPGAMRHRPVEKRRFVSGLAWCSEYEGHDNCYVMMWCSLGGFRAETSLPPSSLILAQAGARDNTRGVVDWLCD